MTDYNNLFHGLFQDVIAMWVVPMIRTVTSLQASADAVRMLLVEIVEGLLMQHIR